MKKLFYLFGLLFFMIALVGCNNEIDNQDDDDDVVDLELENYKDSAIDNLKDFAKLREDVLNGEKETIAIELFNTLKEDVEKATSEEEIDNLVDKYLEDAKKIEFEFTSGLYNTILAQSNAKYGSYLTFGGSLENQFYGIYNNAVVIFTPKTGNALTKKILVDVEFEYATDFTMIVWYESKFYDLFSDYATSLKEVISAAELSKILEKHQEYLTLKNTVLKDILEVYDNYYFKQYFGQFNDAFVFFTPGPTAVLTTITVGGVEITNNSSFSLEVWNGTEFLSIEEAYEAELLTVDDLLIIKELTKNGF